MQLDNYDKILLAFSGGKDSLACLLHLLDSGVDPDKIELWHHDIDGREGSKLMDWPCTRDYCNKVAEAFQMPIFFSWKKGGFEGEMLRENQRTAPIIFEDENKDLVQVGGTRGKLSTRRRYPQVSADLSVRWCSAYLKIDVMTAAINNQKRFEGLKTLVVTGERGQESANRAKYAVLEDHKSDNRDGKRVIRYVDHWRPILDWKEERVWEIIERYRIRVHPAYYLGWGRVSCAACIFGSANQFASLFLINPDQVNRVADYEEEFGVTIKRKDSIRELIAKGSPYPDMKEEDIEDALSETYTRSIIMNDWFQPAGAYGESCGSI